MFRLGSAVFMAFLISGHGQAEDIRDEQLPLAMPWAQLFGKSVFEDVAFEAANAKAECLIKVEAELVKREKYRNYLTVMLATTHPCEIAMVAKKLPLD